jgi:hypothetical protein
LALKNRPDRGIPLCPAFFIALKGKKMPDLTKWVRRDGKTYCWDKAAGKVVEVKVTDIPLDKVPEDVLVAMLNADEKSGE